MTALRWISLLALFATALATPARAQAVGGVEGARPLESDPGFSAMVVLEQPQFRVLRDYLQPRAARRLHSHDDASYHVFVVVTGQVVLNIEGERQLEVTPGQVVSLKGGAKHTFKNIGTATATIIELFGKTAAKGDDDALATALALALDRSATQR
jgi:quercetin dioxygenase-like cupin family protein